ncbi:MAG TPA: YcgN family cysteine cluster protein, partial [Sphingomicrobium sp.]
MNAETPFWEKPLASLDQGQWEALCDGCGRCCLHKLEDEETGLLYSTNVACKMLDRRHGRCLDYKNRKKLVADCVKLDRKNLGGLDWLPSTCAYRLRAAGEPLREWHYLISGSRETVH